MKRIEISRVIAPDRAKYIGFFKTCFRDEYQSLLTTETSRMLDGLENTQIDQILPNEHQKMFEASAAGNLVGTIVSSQNFQLVNVWGLYILPEFQRTGVGSKLLREVCLASEQDTSIEVQVLKVSEKAQNFYKKYGFRRYRSGRDEVFPNIILECDFMVGRRDGCLQQLAELTDTTHHATDQ